MQLEAIEVFAEMDFLTRKKYIVRLEAKDEEYISTIGN